MARAVVFSEVPQLVAELVTTAARVADEVHVVALGQASAAALDGVTSVALLTADAARPEAFVAAIAARVAAIDADVVLVGATVTGWEVAARVATVLGVGLVGEATALRRVPGNDWQAERVVYAGGAVQTESWSGLAVVTVAAGFAPATQDVGAAAPVQVVPVEVDARVRVVSRSVCPHEGVDLAHATRVVCVGMGLGSVDGLAIARGLAEALDAEVACTRPVAEDREWLPTERYIGISGVSVRPDLYLGLGVSGQVQHTVGIREATVVVGINTDPNAPLFGVCDYAVVGDLHEIAPMLAEAVRNARAAAVRS